MVPVLYWLLFKVIGVKDVSAAARSLTDRATDPLSIVLVFVVVAIGAPLAEEIYFRGFAQRIFGRRIRPAFAILASAAFFAASHMQLLQFPALLVFGLILGYMAWRVRPARPGDLGPRRLQHRHRRHASCSTSVEAVARSADVRPMTAGRPARCHDGTAMTDDTTAPLDADAPAAAVDLEDPVVARLGAAIDPPGRLSRAASWPGAALHRASGWGIESWLSLIIVAGCVVFVFTQLGPANVLSSSTPAGGDMGAHVWAPGLPARPPAHVVPAHRLDPRLVRRVPRVPVLHGAAVARDRPAEPDPPVRPGLQAGRHQRRAEPAGGVLGVRQAHPPPVPGGAALRRGRHRLPVRPLVLDLRRQHRLHPGR